MLLSHTVCTPTHTLLKPRESNRVGSCHDISLGSGTETPNPWYCLKSIAGTNGRRTAVQIGGVLQCKLEVYCGVSLSPKLRSQRGTALQMGGVLRYKLEVYRQYFSDTLYGVGGS